MFSLTSLKTLKPQRQQETKTQTPASIKWRSDYNWKFEDGKQMEKTFYQREEKSSQWLQEASQFVPENA